jgi:hypothetical protein
VEKRGQMNKKETIKRITKDIHKTPLFISDPKLADKFSMQVGMEPCSQLGTGERCKVKGCAQPVYVHKSGLCSYHRMMEAENAFEDRLRERRQRAGR